MKRHRPYLARFAQAVHDERLAAGFTLEETARLLGVNGISIVWKWENSKRDGRQSILRACSKGSLAGAALAQRILRRTYPSIGKEAE
jgi:transcriptional regulator with XRE-family HTH domain